MVHWFDIKSNNGHCINIRDEYELLRELELRISDRNLDGLEMVLKAAFFELKGKVTPRKLLVARHLLLMVSSFGDYDKKLVEEYLGQYAEIERRYQRQREKESEEEFVI